MLGLSFIFGCPSTGSDLVFDWQVTLAIQIFEMMYKPYVVHNCDLQAKVTVLQ